MNRILITLIFIVFAVRSMATVVGNITFTGTPSNAVMYATNWIYNSTSQDTNTITVTLAGSSAANGIYKFQRPLLIPGGVWAYTNVSNGEYLIKGDGSGDDVIMIRATTNDLADGSSLYGQPTGNVEGLWELINGVNPLPTVRFATNFLSANFSMTVVAGVHAWSPPINNEIYLDVTNGNDTFWLRGRPDLSIKTFATAATNLTANDVLHVARGQYDFPGSVTLPNGVSILGAGRSLTKIGTAGGGAKLNVRGNNSSFRDFTLGGMIYLGSEIASGSDPVTNVFMENIDVQGSQDGIFASTWESLTAINCRFQSPWDAWSDYQFQVRPTYSNALATFYGCEFLSDDTLPGTAGPEPFIMGSGRVKMFGGSIRRVSTNTGPDYAIFNAANSGGQLGRVDLYGVSVENSSPLSSAPLAISNPQGGIINLHDMDLVASLVSDPLNKVSSTYPPTCISTNWVSGQLYTNKTYRPQFVSVTAKITTAAVAGGAVQMLWVGGFPISQYGQQTTALSLSATNSGYIGGFVPSGQQFTFTNAVVGAGNSATHIPGTGQQVTY